MNIFNKNDKVKYKKLNKIYKKPKRKIHQLYITKMIKNLMQNYSQLIKKNYLRLEYKL